MLKKAILVICDGLGDKPIKELDNLTPLEAAYTPNIDYFTNQAETGAMYTLGRGVVPGSDVAHLALFGYKPEIYYSGRGPIEAYGIALQLKDGDVAFRGNFGTIDSNGIITDRRAGRITDVVTPAEAIDGLEIDGIKFIVKPGTAHRGVVVMRGEGLSSSISSIDPKKTGVAFKKSIPLDNSKEAKFTASVLNKFTQQSISILKDLKWNKERENKGEFPANIALLRGAGKFKSIPSFKERYNFKSACIAGGGLYKGIGSMLGMDVIDIEGATALPNTNVLNKFSKAVELINSNTYDFIFIHVKPTDSLAEDKKPIEKKDFIEKIDRAFSVFKNLNSDTLLVLTADHSTPSVFGTHSADSVPLMFYGDGVRVDDIRTYSERTCYKGSAGIMNGEDLMPHIQNLLGKLPLSGA